MPDRYVKALFYEIRHGPSVDYDKAEPLTDSAEHFDVGVSDVKATFEFKTLFETEDQALEAVSDYIERWEVATPLRFGPDAFRLEYKMPLIEEESPVLGKPRTMGSAHVRFESSGDLTVVNHPPAYPEPPSASNGIRLTPDVRSMFNRYVDCFSGEERLDSMAYFCLTVLEWSAPAAAPSAASVRALCLRSEKGRPRSTT